MNEEQSVAWLAGLYEGEGSSALSQPRKHGGVYPKLVIKMTDEDVIRRIEEYFGGNVSGPYHAVTQSGKEAKPQWTWALTRTEEVLELIERIYPMLGERRQGQLASVREATRFAIMPTEEERFWAMTQADGDCIVWQGHRDNRYGFGTFTQDGGRKRKQAHRYAFELAGECPPRLVNLCGNKACVVTDHWEMA